MLLSRRVKRVDDVGYPRALAEHLVTAWSLDSHRVFVVGFSLGGCGKADPVSPATPIMAGADVLVVVVRADRVGALKIAELVGRGRVRPGGCGVPGFGISGTNAHVIVEEAPDEVAQWRKSPVAGSTPVDGVVPWVMSGRSANVVARQADRLVTRVGGDPELRPADVGVSLVARSVFEHRAVVVGSDREELTAGLRVVAGGGRGDCVVAGRAGVVGKTMVGFPGHGSQWVRMGVELLDSSPVFAEHLSRCEQVLAGLVEWRLTDVLRAVEGAPGFDRVDVVQPVLFSVIVSLARVWESLGVVADGVSEERFAATQPLKCCTAQLPPREARLGRSPNARSVLPDAPGGTPNEPARHECGCAAAVSAGAGSRGPW